MLQIWLAHELRNAKILLASAHKNTRAAYLRSPLFCLPIVCRQLIFVQRVTFLQSERAPRGEPFQIERNLGELLQIVREWRL